MSIKKMRPTKKFKSHNISSIIAKQLLAAGSITLLPCNIAQIFRIEHSTDVIARPVRFQLDGSVSYLLGAAQGRIRWSAHPYVQASFVITSGFDSALQHHLHSAPWIVRVPPDHAKLTWFRFGARYLQCFWDGLQQYLQITQIDPVFFDAVTQLPRGYAQQPWCFLLNTIGLF